MSITAMKQALEALDNLARYADTCELFLNETHPGKANALHQRVTNSIETITSLRQAIEQAEKQEPVGWIDNKGNMICTKINESCKPLYTTPPQRKHVLFPTMLRKMWSGGEVQAWLDENVNKENT